MGEERSVTAEGNNPAPAVARRAENTSDLAPECPICVALKTGQLPLVLGSRYFCEFHRNPPEPSPATPPTSGLKISARRA